MAPFRIMPANLSPSHGSSQWLTRRLRIGEFPVLH
jgi:hypothetical protein